MLKEKNDEYLEGLKRNLKATNSKLRAEAARSLGISGDKYVGASLVELLKNDESSEVQAAAAYALGNLRYQPALETLLALYRKGENSPLDEAIIATLSKLRDKRALKPLLEALTHPQTRIRYLAASALGGLGFHEAVEPLITTLLNDNYTVQQFAASSLAELGNDRAIEPLLQALKSSNEKFKTEDEENEKIEAIAEIALALGKLKSTKALEPLITLLENPNSSIRYFVADALGLLGDQKAVDHLLKIVGNKEESGDVRLRAAESLGLLGTNDTAVIEALANVLNEDEQLNCESLGVNAGKALLKLGYVGLTRLMAELDNADLHLSQNIIRAIQESKNEKAINALIEFRKKPLSLEIKEAIDRAVEKAKVK